MTPLSGLFAIACLLGAQQPVPTTRASLPDGTPFEIHGEYEQRETLWEDGNLVFTDTRTREYILLLLVVPKTTPVLATLDGGERERRIVYEDREHSLGSPGMTWSADHKRAFLWLNHRDQLVELDVEAGTFRTLTDLPSHVWHYKGLVHLDPAPVARWQGVLVDEDAGRLAFVVSQESNEQVAFWQRRSDRERGYRLAVVDVDSASTSFPGAWNEGRARDWAGSLERERVHVLVHRDERTLLESLDLEGRIVETRDLTEEDAVAIALSPDGRWLAVERGLEGETWAPNHPSARGFFLLDLDAGETVEGPTTRGGGCAWSPDGSTLAFVQDWRLLLWHPWEGDHRVLAEREPASEKETYGRGAAWTTAPRWSHDGKRLLCSLGKGLNEPRDVDHTLLVDLERHEFVLLDEWWSDVTWSPVELPRALVPE